MLYSFEYNSFFKLTDKYNINIDVICLDSCFVITISTDEDYVKLTLFDLEVVEVV